MSTEDNLNINPYNEMQSNDEILEKFSQFYKNFLSYIRDKFIDEYISKSPDTNQNNNYPSSNDVKQIFPFYNDSTNFKTNNEEDKEQECNVGLEKNDKNIQKEISIQNGDNQGKIKGKKLKKAKKIKEKIKRGRKDKISGKKRKHNKYSKDNRMNKIKTHYFNTYIIYLFKRYSINKIISLKKICTKFIRDLSKQNNEILFKKKIKDIFCEQPISEKYKKFDKHENKKIIDKIYEENKEKNVIKILELTYEELFIIYRRKLNNLKDKEELEKIKVKIEGLDLLEENNKCKDVDNLIEKLKKDDYDEDYIKQIKKTCLEYKDCFINKKEPKSK